MVRDEALNENDSGWSFMAGNEDEEYINDYRNLVLMKVGAVYQRDPAIFGHIDSPVGTSFVRVSPVAFEPDEEGKKIYMEHTIIRIRSGGQSGVDRAALDFARCQNIEI